MHRLYTKLHKTILGFADIGSMKKKEKKVQYTSKNILKMIKQRNQ